MSNPDMEMALRTTDIDAFDCSNVACGIKAGQTLGVQLVVIGTIVKHPTYYYVSAQLVHIISGVVVKTVEEEITGSWYDMEAQMPVIAKKLVGQRDDEPEAAAAAVPPAPAVQTAQVADGGGGFKWYYAGLGLLVAGGVGLLLLNDSDSNTTTPAGDDPEEPAPTPVQLPGPPTFP
jgi:hypothetical protein